MFAITAQFSKLNDTTVPAPWDP